MRSHFSNVVAIAIGNTLAFGASACDSPGGAQESAEGTSCEATTCGANEVCQEIEDERCESTPACEANDTCRCWPSTTAVCGCVDGAIREAGGCRTIERGFVDFTPATVSHSGAGYLSITDGDGLTACGLAVSDDRVMNGVSQLRLEVMGCPSEVQSIGDAACKLPSDSYSMSSKCPWFRVWDAEGKLVRQDVAVGGAMRGEMTVEGGSTLVCALEVELTFSGGATYQRTITFEVAQVGYDEATCLHP